MRLIPADEAARRARAAIAYKGVEIADLARLTGIKPGTIRNITSRTDPKSGTIERLWAIADACEVPREFMERGFALGELDVDRTIADRSAIRDHIRLDSDERLAVDQVAREQIARLEAELRKLRGDDATSTADGAPPVPPGELGRRAGATPTTPKPTRPGSTDPEGDTDARRA